MADKCESNGVVHKDFFNDGRVQALAFKDGKGLKSVGVVGPGLHDFGKADAPETIVVTSGALTINGFIYSTAEGHASCPIKIGDPIVFKADDFASYLCIKG
ncbi:MAG: pyrimidine/purine nucleoside phosphorylase [Candidatus Parcubacteria bacterium]|nr:pyrimidine/purine nucleoside phosphorylase [Candidatus Parcubacteria bacterium]